MLCACRSWARRMWAGLFGCPARPEASRFRPGVEALEHRVVPVAGPFEITITVDVPTLLTSEDSGLTAIPVAASPQNAGLLLQPVPPNGTVLPGLPREWLLYGASGDEPTPLHSESSHSSSLTSEPGLWPTTLPLDAVDLPGPTSEPEKEPEAGEAQPQGVEEPVSEEPDVSTMSGFEAKPGESAVAEWDVDQTPDLNASDAFFAGSMETAPLWQLGLGVIPLAGWLAVPRTRERDDRKLRLTPHRAAA